jgi:hypothetical protein
MNVEAGRKPIQKLAPFQAASFGHFSDDRWQSNPLGWSSSWGWRASA